MELGQQLGWDTYFYSIFARTMDMQEFTAVALRALRELRFDFFAYGMCSVTPFMRPRTYMYGNYPEDWVQRYQAANYAVIDPTVKHSKVSSFPILWSNELFRGARICGPKPTTRIYATAWHNPRSTPRGGLGC